VRACCQNITGSLGNIRAASIREIWDGQQTARLRGALQEGDFSLGCSHCAWQDDQGGNAIRYSHYFDPLWVTEEHPRWPKRMEFALSNGCNLQCTMCTGWNSSAIRAHREHLPPLAIPYDDAFFEELAEFLPHLESVVVLGGEPFVAPESMRVLEMVADLDEPPHVMVITNATQWTPRVQRLFDRLPMAINVSLDGITAPTFESIRVGAELDTVLANLDRYGSRAHANGLDVGISFCLMTSNWHEFADLLAFAEDQALDFVSVNIVTAPREHSIYRLSRSELALVVDRMAAQEATTGGRFGRFRSVWDDHLATLRDRLATFPEEGESSVPGSLPWEGGANPLVEVCHAHIEVFAPEFDTLVVRANSAQHITGVATRSGRPAAPHLAAMVDRPLAGLLEAMANEGSGVFSPTMATTDLSNEFSFAAVSETTTDVSLMCFFFHDGEDLVVLVGHRSPS
jgi:MoaA/NifB/PqqE/SkfB family radical SAM enzyme